MHRLLMMAKRALAATGALRRYLTLPDNFSLFLYLAAMLAVAMMLRTFFFPYESYDYRGPLSRWFHFLQANHGFMALRDLQSDYPPLYLYFLALFTYLPFPALFTIKAFSTLFDILAAAMAFRLVKIKSGDNFLPALAFTALLFWPTVVLNGSMWGQCDIIYTSLLLAMLCLLMTRKYAGAMALFGLAISFKLQAIFLLPLLFIFWFKREITVWHLALIPLVFVLSCLPIILLGKPLASAVSIYWLQAGQFPTLAKNALTVYQWVPQQLYPYFIWPGVLLALAVILSLGLVLNRFLRELDPGTIILLALAFSLAVPFMLPKMHERYFFLADVISVIYAFYFPRKFYLPLVIGVLSYFSYYPFLFGTSLFELKYLSLGMAAAVILVLKELLDRFRPAAG